MNIKLTIAERAWSLSTGRTPQISRQTVQVAPPVIIDEQENSRWILYTDDGISFDQTLWSSRNIRTVHLLICQLSGIINDTLDTLYISGSKLNMQVILEVYT